MITNQNFINFIGRFNSFGSRRPYRVLCIYVSLVVGLFIVFNVFVAIEVVLKARKRSIIAKEQPGEIIAKEQPREIIAREQPREIKGQLKFIIDLSLEE